MARTFASFKLNEKVTQSTEILEQCGSCVASYRVLEGLQVYLLLVARKNHAIKTSLQSVIFNANCHSI